MASEAISGHGTSLIVYPQLGARGRNLRVSRTSIDTLCTQGSPRVDLTGQIRY